MLFHVLLIGLGEYLEVEGVSSPSSSPSSPPSQCPPGCYCDQKKDEAAVKVNCHPLDSGPADSFEQVTAALSPLTTQLDLARYGLDELMEGSFARAPDLIKLDLQNNEIAHIEEGAFQGLGRLQVLDLSRNKLEVVTQEMLLGLDGLTRLKINDNRIQTIESGAFQHLMSLSRLEMSDNPFICDCNLEWLIEWLSQAEGRVTVSNSAKTRCALPIALTNVPLRKIGPDMMTCDGSSTSGSSVTTNNLSKKDGGTGSLTVRLVPDQDLVTFEGDPASLTCSVEVNSNASAVSVQVLWLVRGKPVTNNGDDKGLNLTVTTVSRGASLVESTLTADALSVRHSGQWACQLTTSAKDGGSRIKQQQRSIDVLVVGAAAKLCPPKMTMTSRGRYVWGAAVGGHTIRQKCLKPKRNENGGAGGDVRTGFAHLLCREGGEWAANANVSQCGYTSKVGKPSNYCSLLGLFELNCVVNMNIEQLRTSCQPVVRV